MAHIDYVDDRYGALRAGGGCSRRPQTRRARFGAVVNWAGALMSLGLVIGMSVWAFQLLMRDVSGVPVIAAIEGPMREPPADPGGTQAPHQGLAVNRIAEGEEAQPVPDRLVLAPPPIELQEVRFEPEAPVDLAPVPRTEIAAGGRARRRARPATRSETTALIDRLLQEAQPGDRAPVGDRRRPRKTRRAGPRIDGHDGDRRASPAHLVPGIARSIDPPRGPWLSSRRPRRVSAPPMHPSRPRKSRSPTCRTARVWCSLAPSTPPRSRGRNGTASRPASPIISTPAPA
jgi:hypothetical protein